MKKLKNKKLIITILITSIIIATFSTYKLKKQETLPTGSNVSKYEILVDVEESKMYVFQDGNLLETHKCSGRKMVNTFTNWHLDNSF